MIFTFGNLSVILYSAFSEHKQQKSPLGFSHETTCDPDVNLAQYSVR